LYLIACDVAQNMINTIPTLDAPGNVSVTSFCPEGFVVPIGGCFHPALGCHAEKGFGVTFNDITKGAAFYT